MTIIEKEEVSSENAGFFARCFSGTPWVCVLCVHFLRLWITLNTWVLHFIGLWGKIQWSAIPKYWAYTVNACFSFLHFVNLKFKISCFLFILSFLTSSQCCCERTLHTNFDSAWVSHKALFLKFWIQKKKWKRFLNTDHPMKQHKTLTIPNILNWNSTLQRIRMEHCKQIHRMVWLSSFSRRCRRSDKGRRAHQSRRSESRRSLHLHAKTCHLHSPSRPWANWFTLDSSYQSLAVEWKALWWFNWVG